VTLTEREGSTSCYWIGGSRERYGEAYFISTVTGSGVWHLWQNRRPYAPNKLVGEVEWPPTWEQIDALVSGDAS
jgi:hypothetical protein